MLFWQVRKCEVEEEEKEEEEKTGLSK